ncbi:L-aspartate oxidase [Desulfovibrionales bacterium]
MPLYPESRLYTPALVVGAGIAGATCALTLADAGIETILVTTGPDLFNCNSSLAQGGIVYRATDEDPKLLECDILHAGRNHNYVRAVRFLCHNGPQAVYNMLIKRLQIPFYRCSGDAWDLRLEGGHTTNRILHCADHTGWAIMKSLNKAIQNHSNIHILTHHTAVDLLTSHHHARSLEYKYHIINQCAGAYIFNEQSGEVKTVFSDATVLATGGMGRIYLHTTNAASSIGSGLAMAFRAGARIINAEYVQFHPTTFYRYATRRFLITEALRGEGAQLVNAAGEAFMSNYDPHADLAPRDVVTQAIMEEILKSGEECVFLDAAHYTKDPDALLKRFPTVYQKCLENGIDIQRDPIPVVPAAHYFIGGILADTRGRTSLNRLYAIGECSCTGVHGANRLASTSLLEGLLWGNAAAKDISHRLKNKTSLSRSLQDSIPEWDPPGQINNEDPALIAQDWATIRHTMWNYVGITRTGPRLARAVSDLHNLYKHLLDFYKRTPLSKPLVDLFHGCYAAYIVTRAAERNKHSLGCHYRVD